MIVLMFKRTKVTLIGTMTFVYWIMVSVKKTPPPPKKKIQTKLLLNVTYFSLYLTKGCSVLIFLNKVIGSLLFTTKERHTWKYECMRLFIVISTEVSTEHFIQTQNYTINSDRSKIIVPSKMAIIALFYIIVKSISKVDGDSKKMNNNANQLVN